MLIVVLQNDHSHRLGHAFGPLCGLTGPQTSKCSISPDLGPIKIEIEHNSRSVRSTLISSPESIRWDASAVPERDRKLTPHPQAIPTRPRGIKFPISKIQDAVSVAD